jgi:OmpA-OmpF porin, OOP family
MKKIIMASVLTISAMPLHAESNFTWEVLLGKANQKTSLYDFSTSGDDSSIGIRAAYLFNKNIAIELAYQNYGEAVESFVFSGGNKVTDKMKTAALNFGLKGSIPLDESFSLISRFGLSMWDFDLTETNLFYPDENIKFRDDGTDIYYGIGAQYNFNENIFIIAEYSITDIGTTILGYQPIDHEVKNTSISLGVNF